VGKALQKASPGQLALPGCQLTAVGLKIDRGISFETWQAIGKRLRQVEACLLWWVGDWLNHGELKWKETYQQAAEETGFAYQTLANARTVARAFNFSRRREKLTWSHHAEVASLHESEQEEFLDEAEANHWTTRQLRQAKNGWEKPTPGEGVAEYFTLDQWKRVTPAAQQELLRTEGNSRFNRQVTESIGWALWSWNPVTGCEHNCPYCYARDIAERFYPQQFVPSLVPERLTDPRNTPFPEAAINEEPHPERRRGLGNVFVCSMADLFGRWVPGAWIEAVLDAVRAAPQWTFLFLTKFPVRMAEFDFPENAWVGTTVDCQARVANAERAFRKVKAGVKWLSLEPLLEPLHFQDLGAFQWIVLGGASASSQTPEWHPPRSWVQALEDEARRLRIPYYEKQNLFRRDCAFPGDTPGAEPTEAPPELHYLPRDRR
jgi:protein gp37